MALGRSQPGKMTLPLWALLIVMFALVTVLTSWALGAIVKNIASRRLMDEYTESVTNTTRLLITTSITPELLANRQAMQKFVKHWASLDSDLSMVQLVDANGEIRFDWLRNDTAVHNPIYITLSVDYGGVKVGDVFAQWKPESMIKEVNRRVSMAQRFGTGITIALAIVFFTWTHWLVVRPVVAIDRRLRSVVSRDEHVSDKGHWLSDELQRLDNTTDLLAMEIKRREEAEQSAIEARNQALEANVAKSRFLANMSHELRTPLNSIMGYSEMIREDAEEGGTTQIIGDAGRINTAAEHLLRLINDVLDLSKIEAGKIELLSEEVDVDNLLGDMMMMTRPLAEEHKNKLVYKQQSQCGRIVIDSVRLKQVIYNLLSNACKFTRSGTISLMTERYTDRQTEWISIAVTDTGIGIEDNKLEKMFEEFSQADATISRQYGGTGLGLPISRKLCGLMGGDLSVRSEVGKGSTFVVTLPCNTAGCSRSDRKQSAIHITAINQSVA